MLPYNGYNSGQRQSALAIGMSLSVKRLQVLRPNSRIRSTDSIEESTQNRCCARLQTVLRRRGAVLSGKCGQKLAISEGIGMQLLGNGTFACFPFPYRSMWAVPFFSADPLFR